MWPEKEVLVSYTTAKHRATTLTNSIHQQLLLLLETLHQKHKHTHNNAKDVLLVCADLQILRHLRHATAAKGHEAAMGGIRAGVLLLALLLGFHFLLILQTRGMLWQVSTCQVGHIFFCGWTSLTKLFNPQPFWHRFAPQPPHKTGAKNGSPRRGLPSCPRSIARSPLLGHSNSLWPAKGVKLCWFWGGGGGSKRVEMASN